MILTVETSGRRVELMPDQKLTFGRDETCDICLDKSDLGISRIAGEVTYQGGYWTVTNLSHKRALHIIDEIGFVVPLPVADAGIGSRRVVDRPRMTVLVVGDSFTHALVLAPDNLPKPGDAPKPADPLSTRTQQPRLTERRREVVVAMAAGYLRQYPQYDPHPRTYQEVADLLGLTKSQVIKRVEDIREDLVAAGVSGLQSELDARRPLCEWLLAMRLIGPADLDWLRPRIVAAQRQRSPVEETKVEHTVRQPQPETRRAGGSRNPDRAAVEVELPTTTHPVIDEITHIAERTARHVAPALLARLRRHYGDNWLTAVNAHRPPRDHARRQDLRDYRFCLSILANDPATRGWITEECRHSAAELNRMANVAAHRRTLVTADIERARKHSSILSNGIPPKP